MNESFLISKLLGYPIFEIYSHNKAAPKKKKNNGLIV